MKRSRQSAVFCAVLVTALAGGGAAAAAETQQASDATQGVVEETIQRELGNPARPTETTRDHVVGETSSGTVVLPRSAGEPVQFLNSADEMVLEITLPASSSREPARTVMPGQLSFEGTAESTDTIVQLNDRANASASILAVMHDADAPSRHTYEIDVAEGTELRLHPSGAVELHDTRGTDPGDDTAVAVVDAPWAYDANGNTVPAEFELDGSTLVLQVDHRGAAYPVVADPDVTTNCGWTTCSIYWSRARTQAINSWTALIGPGNALLSFGCHYAPAGADEAACMVVGGGSSASPVTLTALGVILHSADANNACFKITRTRGTAIPTYVSTNQGTYCTNV